MFSLKKEQKHSYYSLPETKITHIYFNYINAKIIIESVYILKHKLYLIENVS